jgi:hypothetical protein
LITVLQANGNEPEISKKVTGSKWEGYQVVLQRSRLSNCLASTKLFYLAYLTIFTSSSHPPIGGYWFLKQGDYFAFSKTILGTGVALISFDYKDGRGCLDR